MYVHSVKAGIALANIKCINDTLSPYATVQCNL